jgi:dihydroneopterin aldolase
MRPATVQDTPPPDTMTAPQEPLARRRRVFVHGLELMGSIGVYEHEHRDRQLIVVSLDLDVVDTYNGHSDKLADVYDYDIAISTIRGTVDSGHFNLIETLAEAIASAVLADRRALAARVRIEKPAVLTACRSIGIEIERQGAG